METVLGSLGLTDDERGLTQQTLERMVREQAGARGVAILMSPINIGIGTKREPQDRPARRQGPPRPCSGP